MKRALPAVGLVLFSLLGLLSLTARAGGAELNLLLVTIDTLRPDRLSCYSPKYLETPRIDALAAKGVLFERAFAAYNLAVAYLGKGDKAKALENCQKYLLIRGRSITEGERKEINALIQKIKG